MNHWALAGIAALALGGCDRAPGTPEPMPSPSASGGQPESIIRDDIEVEREVPPLAPLAVRIGFPEGGAELSDSALAELAKVLKSPQMAAGGAITVRGHTDSTGSDEANLRASQARAEAVRDWLVEHGVDEARVTIVALGEQNPAEPNALPDGSPNEPGRAANRRVEISIAVPPGTPSAQPAGRPKTLAEELARPAD